MRLLYRIEDFLPPKTRVRVTACYPDGAGKQTVSDNAPRYPLSITIGNFDGLHRGHQALFSHMPGHRVVITFSNHTRDILYRHACPRITTLSHRLHLFEQAGIDTLILIPFTEGFAAQSAEDFLLTLHKEIPFSHAVLGYDAVLGCDRMGNANLVTALAQKIGFSVTYLPPIEEASLPISSRRVREAIHKGELDLAGHLLGRPYSILTHVAYGKQKGRLLGFPTANLVIDQLVLPPLGVYFIQTMIDHRTYFGVANLGHAPTLHAERPPLLEVHLLEYRGELYHKNVEVVFLRFLRPERRFASMEQLKAQIGQDIAQARALCQPREAALSVAQGNTIYQK